MLNKKSYILCFLEVIIALFFITSCISVEEVDNVVMYSREDVAIMTESESFGKGRSDDIYVALSYVYNDKMISEKHGSDFEITADNIICHASEGESFLFVGNYKGNAEYSFLIDGCSYRISLSKKYSGKWVVDEFFSEEQ